MTSKTDVAAEITALMIKKIESGTMPWERPWHSQSLIPLRHNGERYTGINHLYLSCVTDSHGYTSPYWMTYRQASELGSRVRKGEHGYFSVYFNRATKTDHNTVTGEDTTRTFGFLKHYFVFNADQIEGLPPHYHPPVPEPRPVGSMRPAAQAFFDAIPIPVRHRGSEAFYRPLADEITLPDPGLFKTIDHYISTRAHETIHATGHKSRLDRRFGKRFGSDAYAAEEMVASIGQSGLCALFDLPPELHDNHASYLESWLRVLKGDKTAIIHAAAKAEQAIKWLHDCAAQAELRDAA